MWQQRGFGLIEVIVGTGIITLVTIGSGYAIHFYIKTGLAQTERVQAAYLLEEGLEAARFIRDAGFTAQISTIATGTPLYIATSSTGWATTTTPILVEGKFSRTVQFDDVWRRDSDKDIVPVTSVEAKTKDPDARKVTVRVVWPTVSGKTATTTATTYLTNVFNN